MTLAHTGVQAIAYAQFHVEDCVKSAARLADGWGFTVDGTANIKALYQDVERQNATAGN